ncbi:MAG: exodeoxyribonuclease V subunit alpha [Pseudomonadota bacterium]
MAPDEARDIEGQLSAWREHGWISDFDCQVATLVARHETMGNAWMSGLAACVLSWMTRAGHVCVQLDDVAQTRFPYEVDDVDDVDATVVLPAAAQWRATLSSSRAAAPANDIDRRCPMVLDQSGRLYWHRGWTTESAVADALCRLGEGGVHQPDVAGARTLLEDLFPSDAAQRQAAAMAIQSRLVVLTGGPGTGKTQTVARILVALNLLATKAGNASGHKIALAAPTGKAAARLRNSLRAAIANIPQAGSTLNLAESAVQTLHGLLRVGLSGGRDRDMRIDADTVVIDEASMVDLDMMHRLLHALRAHTRLLLVGDAHQLASVEAGQVFADISNDAPTFTQSAADALGLLIDDELIVDDGPRSAIGDCVVALTTNYRFAPDSRVGGLARAINTGDVETAVRLVRDGEDDLIWKPNPELSNHFFEGVLDDYQDYLNAVARGLRPGELLLALESFRLLCAHRHGRFGTIAINSALDRLIRQRRGIVGDRTWYPGRAIIMSRNDHDLGVYNGDVGVYWEQRGVGHVYVADEHDHHRAIPLERLPDHELAYAMTVHKSQGSEFDRITCLLPEPPSPIVTRELLYTAVTRARYAMTLVASEVTLRAALERVGHRHSGLSERLRRPNRRG